MTRFRFNDGARRYSGMLVVTMHVHRADGVCELVAVQGNANNGDVRNLSDVGWFEEAFSQLGEDLLGDAAPAITRDGTYEFVGQMHSEPLGDGEYDDVFRVHGVRRVG